jgi:hypothetical protein
MTVKSQTNLVIITQGMTSQLQVLEVVVKPFRVHLCHLYTELLLSGNSPLTPTGNVKKPCKTLLGEWINEYMRRHPI